MIIRPAVQLDRAQLLELFNAGYSDYVVPLRMGAGELDEHLDINGIDLNVSQIAYADGPAAFALVGRRGDEGWIGGMGTHPAHRRQGLGEAALRAAVTAARSDGCGAVRLEVIEDNDRAIALYEKLRFTRMRELVVAQLNPPAGTQGPDPDGGIAVAVSDRDAQRWVAGQGGAPLPWQRSDAALERLRHRGARLRGIVRQLGGRTTAAAVVRDQAEITGVLQIAAKDAAAAAGLLRAMTTHERPLRLVNVPADDPAAAALQRLRAQVIVRQHEMRLTSDATWAPVPAG